MNKVGRIVVHTMFIEDEGSHRALVISYKRLWRDHEFESKITTTIAFKSSILREHRLAEAVYEIGTPLSNDISIILIEGAEMRGFLGPPFLMLPYIL